MQEEEADCLAATLLLPKEAWFKIKFSGKPVATTVKQYGVIKQPMQMRLEISGVNSIYKRTRK